jgi:hypothetical protein
MSSLSRFVAALEVYREFPLTVGQVFVEGESDEVAFGSPGIGCEFFKGCIDFIVN